eukprot:jgi/Psemu1/285514/fgenesh1_pg.91_\
MSLKMIRVVHLFLSFPVVTRAFSCGNNDGILPSKTVCKHQCLATSTPPAITHLNAEPLGQHQQEGVSRRDAIATAASAASAFTSGVATAEVTWRTFVRDARVALATEPASSSTMGAISPSVLPSCTMETIEAGKAAIIDNWLTPEETRALCEDARDCFRGGHFTNFILSRNPKKADKFANDRWIMPSFASSQGVKDGPFVDPAVGSLPVRESLKRKMAAVKASLASGLTDRPTLSNDNAQTHEMEYLRYGAGALLNRHTDEHHLELKRPHGSSLPLKANASRRSITWLVYLNDDWTTADGGELRLHERAHESVVPVGARNRNDLQVGWLRAIPEAELGEQPVFLDPFGKQPDGRVDPNESCLLYTFDGSNSRRRELSRQPFANAALYLGGGDALARGFMVDYPVDRRRFHLIDAPKSLVAELAKTRAPPHGEDRGEKYRDVLPKAGTLVLFDSVSLPHEVLTTNRERFGVQGWFHEMIEQPV